jgi:hypothetical protein
MEGKVDGPWMGLFEYNIYYNLNNTQGDYFRFGSVFIKKNNETKFFLKKTKTISNRFGSVFFVWVRLVFLVLGL